MLIKLCFFNVFEQKSWKKEVKSRQLMQNLKKKMFAPECWSSDYIGKYRFLSLDSVWWKLIKNHFFQNFAPIFFFYFFCYGVCSIQTLVKIYNKYSKKPVKNIEHSLTEKQKCYYVIFAKDTMSISTENKTS